MKCTVGGDRVRIRQFRKRLAEQRRSGFQLSERLTVPESSGPCGSLVNILEPVLIIEVDRIAYRVYRTACGLPCGGRILCRRSVGSFGPGRRFVRSAVPVVPSRSRCAGAPFLMLPPPELRFIQVAQHALVREIELRHAFVRAGGFVAVRIRMVLLGEPSERRVQFFDVAFRADPEDQERPFHCYFHSAALYREPAARTTDVGDDGSRRVRIGPPRVRRSRCRILKHRSGSSRVCRGAVAFCIRDRRGGKRSDEEFQTSVRICSRVRGAHARRLPRDRLRALQNTARGSTVR